MANDYYDQRAGLGNVGSYQASSRPFLSSSIEVLQSGTPVVTIEFPTVTKFITVKNTGDINATDAPMRVGFSENGVNGISNDNYFILLNDESFSADWRVSRVYLRVDSGVLNATASVIAGETGINSLELQHNWTGSTGVG